jgi:hypothetical protein
MEPAPTPLGYAPPRRRRGRAVWRRAGIASLVVAATIVCAKFGGPVWAEYRQRRALAVAFSWQQQCMACTIPSGTVVYQEGQGAAEVARQPDHTLEMTQAADLFPDNRWGPFFCATYHPQCWARFSDALRQASVFVGAPARSVLFLHERRTPAGNARLVMVEFCPIGVGWLRANVVIPGTKQSPAGAALTATTLSVRRTTDRDVLEILAGQEDAADPSHFALDCRFNGKPCVIDGYLRDDDHVRLRPRSGRCDATAGGADWWPEGSSPGKSD